MLGLRLGSGSGLGLESGLGLGQGWAIVAFFQSVPVMLVRSSRCSSLTQVSCHDISRLYSSHAPTEASPQGTPDTMISDSTIHGADGGGA